MLNLQSQETKFKNFSLDDGLPGEMVYNIIQDEIGYLWIATEKGVVKFDGINFEEINKTPTFSIFSDGRTKYFGLDNGLSIYKNNKTQFFESKKILKILSHNNNIFLATTEGVSILMEDYIQPIPINGNVDFSIINDILFFDDAFYIASNKGLWKVNNLKKPENSKLLIDDSIISILEFDNKLIVATKNNGLKIIKNSGILNSYKTISDVSAIKKVNNELWITSHTNGIEVLVLPSFSFKKNINKYNSLQTDFINSVYIDKNNNVFITSNKGIYLFENEMIVNSNKKIYFENLIINHQHSDSLLTSKAPILLYPSENNISISFKTVDLQSPKKIQYRYQFTDGFSDWSYSNQLQFANLDAGKYTLKIQSKVGDLLSNISSLKFTINTPIYKGAPFILTLSIILLLTGYLWIHFYIKSIHTKNKIKFKALQTKNHLLTLEQKALQLQMNPHFIFNVLNGIKALGNNGKIDQLNTTINKFSILLRSILHNSRKEEITLKEEIVAIKNYIELEQSMNSKVFEYSIETITNNIDLDEVIVPSMLIQPFIENSIQHGFQPNKKGILTIKIEIIHGFLHFTIIDNGIGISNSREKTSTTNNNSLALKVTKERIYYLTPVNSFNIDDIKEGLNITGTRVYFKIPLKTDY
ncbi:MAG: histidine kinase [Polaribacter sp.]|uniref:sensor histidine kinase n=1 Tax=Polaribacter sp. TaxID=1920175 RepID=UPI003BB0DFB2